MEGASVCRCQCPIWVLDVVYLEGLVQACINQPGDAGGDLPVAELTALRKPLVAKWYSNSPVSSEINERRHLLHSGELEVKAGQVSFLY